MIPAAFLIEDNIEIRHSLIAAMDELASTQVIAYAEGQAEALAWLQNNPDSWVITIIDLFLKEGSGLGVLALAAPRKQGQRMVVLSNYATADIRSQCKELGADAFFDKSTQLDEFFDYCLALG